MFFQSLQLDLLRKTFRLVIEVRCHSVAIIENMGQDCHILSFGIVDGVPGGKTLHFTVLSVFLDSRAQLFMLLNCVVMLALVWPEQTHVLHQFLGMMWELAWAKICSLLTVRGLTV